MVAWDAWEYRTVWDGLELGPGEPTRPASWRSGVRSIEATVQTLLAFHLETFTGLPLRLVRSAAALDSSADLIATDALQRVHLFELKQRAINEQAASQIEKYLLRHVFADACEFLAAARERGRSQFSPYEIAKELLGFYANERPELLGLDLVNRSLGAGDELRSDGIGHRLTRGRWTKLPNREKLIRLHASLRAKERGNRSTQLPPLDEIVAVAESWSSRLLADLAERDGGLVAGKPLVVWLVGSSLTPGADERIRLWRRAGIDARVLRMTATKDGRTWTVGVRREYAPGRDRVEQELLEAAGSRTSGLPVKIEFYDEVPASKPRRLGGSLLEEPRWKTRSS